MATPARPAHVARKVAQARQEPEPSAADAIVTPELRARLADIDPAIDYQLGMSGPWADLLAEAMTGGDLGPDDVETVLTAWAAKPRGDRPQLDRLWWRRGPRAGWPFVEQALGRSAVVVPLRPKRQPLQDDFDPAAELAELDRRKGRA